MDKIDQNINENGLSYCVSFWQLCYVNFIYKITVAVDIYTHVSQNCNISKANCAAMRGIKLEGSYYL